MAHEPRTRNEQNALFLRCVLAFDGDVEIRRVALHAFRSRLAARLAATAASVVALLIVSEDDPQLGAFGLLWLVLVLAVCRTFNEMAFTQGTGRQRWLPDAVSRPLLAASLLTISLAAWDASTLPVSLLGSAAVLEVYGQLAFARVRAAMVGHDLARSSS
jgi:hypothetical protein